MAQQEMTIGVKGSDCYVETGSKVLDLSVMLNRGLEEETIRAAIAEIFRDGSLQDKVDTFVLAFQTRDIRGGKGERDLFRHMFLALLSVELRATLETLDLVPEYGYWEDINRLAQASTDLLLDPCVQLIRTQFLADEVSTGKLSLLARHMPREHNKKAGDKVLAKTLARALCPGPKALEQYRKRLSALTARLGVAEVKMSSGKWSSLDPATMPGRCLKTKLKGLLNQPVSGRYGRKVVLEDHDRVMCAERFKEHLSRAARGEAKVKGANVVFPHELVARVLSGGLSAEEEDAVEAQWRSIVDPLKALGTMGRWLAMCDFSGSMDGDPMCVSMALGLIVSECNTGCFQNCILTFDSNPTLHRFRSTGLVARVREVARLCQGTSTNFQAAYNLVLETLAKGSVPLGQEPTDLIVLTDMGFDAACGYGYGYGCAVKTKEQETHFQIVRKAFVAQGQALGTDWVAPRIVCWNLRGEYRDFQATAGEEGVLEVSGWSPSMFKVLTTRGFAAFTPAAMLRALLSDPRYDAVRERVECVLDGMPPLVPQ